MYCTEIIETDKIDVGIHMGIVHIHNWIVYFPVSV